MTALVTFGETPLRFSPPEDERLEQVRETRVHADGTESNVACAAHELGTETTWLSKLPDTPLGRRVVSQIRSRGVETGIAWTDETEGPGQGLVFREPAEPPRESRRWHNRTDTAAASASPSDFPMEQIQQAEMLFTGLHTPALGEEIAETTQAMVRAGNSSGTRTAIDIDYAPGLAPADTFHGVFDILSANVDILFGNVADIRAVLDYSGGARELANVIAAEYDFDIIVVTRSDLGAVALHDSPGTNLIYERDALDSNPVDTTGQHAAFVGAFLSELLDGAEVARALDVAVAAAALARTIEGPLLITTAGELEPLVDRVAENSR
jgi:2-dehydro-3-deoxygluconokinase